MKHSFSPDSRRGISSVVGALIFTVLMIAGFSAMSLALDSQSDIVNTQRVVADVELQAQQEEFEIEVSTNVNNILNVTVNNIGQNSVQISHLFITNKTLASQPVQDFFINPTDEIISPQHKSNVLSTQPLYMIPDIYDIKIISALGTVKTAELNMISGSSSGLRAELVTDPPDVIIGQNVTVAMIVTNTGDSTITNVHPNSLTFSSTGIGSVMASSSYTPTSVDLNGGASVMFSWDYQVTGNSGDNLTFSSFATGEGSKISNTASDVSTLRLPTDGSTGGIDPDIINEELLARPKLFLIIPSSQGDSNQKALWGVNIANPVNAPMSVSKVSIVAYAPGANSNEKIYSLSCNAEDISPASVVNNWSCPTENVIMWQNYDNPIVIAPNSTKAFLTKILPGTVSGSINLESITVQANVFTTVGSFGKAGYQTTMYNSGNVIGNVYLSKAIDSRSNGDMISTMTGIVPGSTNTFNIVFADLDTSQSTYIKSGAKLIINIPKGWTNVSVASGSYPGFVSTPIVTTFGDGSSQIIGTTTSKLGDANNQADTIQFTAKAPSVVNDQMYVIYVLGQGQTSNNFSIGPLAEIVLQVDAS